MALSPYDPRDEVTDTLMKQRGASTFDYGLAGLGSAQQPMSMAGPPGLPVSPAGGVPGAGIAAAGPSNVQLPQQRAGMRGAMPAMPGLGAMGAPMAPGMGMGGMPQMAQQQRRRPMY